MGIGSNYREINARISTMSDGVTQWLEQLGLGEYAEAFEENAIELEHLGELDHDTLKEIGVRAVGHRMTILKAVGDLELRAGFESEPGSVSPLARRSSSPEAERRQLTVMFCDLVGSTDLSQKLDPEDLREVNRAYQDACTAAIERYEGYVARYMGDGVLAYFGYPQAHEDDAERAVHAGLGVVDSVTSLRPTVGDGQEIELGVRVGIATGSVVVGDLIGEGASQESAVVGETPNLAARLQGLAPVNAVVVASSTSDLIASRFDLEDLGDHHLKGIAHATRVWRVVGKSDAESRFEALHATRLTELVGREHEMGLLLERWEQTKDGDGQVVLLTGEAGIGKSRMIETLAERTARDEPARLRYQCSPFHTNSALYPVIEHIERAAHFVNEDSAETKLDKLESMLALGTSQVHAVAPLFASLLSIPTGERYEPLSISTDRQKEQTLGALVAQLEGLSLERPLLFLFEDLHWADPTSLELVERFIERASRMRVLAVLSSRPSFTPPWAGHAHVSSITLNRLSRRTVEELIGRVARGKAIPDELREQIVEKTDGIPLFVEELTKTVLESGLLKETADEYVLNGSLAALAIPSTLHDSLMARLDRLSPVKGVAQTAAAIGREFSFEMLAAVSTLDNDALEQALEQLIEAELVFRSGRASHRVFVFKHALIQDVAYDSLLKSTRRALHGRIAEVIESEFPHIAPEILAHHYTEAGLAKPAVDLWVRAGHHALDRSADREAVAHLRKGLLVLDSMEESAERDRRELDLQIPLYRALTTTTGWGSKEATKVHERIRELCERTGDSDHLIAVLVGDRIRHWKNAECRAAIEIADRIIDLAKRRSDPAQSAFGHLLAGWPRLALGELSAIRPTVNHALEQYDPEARITFAFSYQLDTRVSALGMRAYHELLCGFPERAARSSAEAVAWARELNHAGSLAWALHWGMAQPAAMRGDVESAGAFAGEVVALPEARRSPLDLAWGHVFAGWALGKRGQRREGIAMIHLGLEYLVKEGFMMFNSVQTALLAELYLDDGQHAKALETLESARTHMERTDERLWEAEIARLNGLVLLARETGADERSEACFNQALEVARRQGAKWLELRAATSLARLAHARGTRDYGRDLLTPIYDSFTEGFDTPDVRDAKALLEQLS